MNVIGGDFHAAKCAPQNDGLSPATVCLFAGARNNEVGKK
jgi:hypothetical protein